MKGISLYLHEHPFELSKPAKIKSGKLLRNTFLPFHVPMIGDAEKKEVLDSLKNGWLTKGPKTEFFEKQFAARLGVPYAVGTNSCTAALHLALVVQGVGPGDEVITTPMTFAATINVIEHCGAKPVFIDVEEDTLNINPDLIEAAITSRTKAILVVHFAGQMCQMDKICAIARKHRLPVIEDAAHALESTYRGKSPGHWGDLAAFSFYATKNITTGEGGMIVTRDRRQAERLAILSVHGLSKHAWKRYSNESYQHYEIIEAGFKYHMTDLQAALGIHQLKRVEVFWEKRKRLAAYYDQSFYKLDEILPLRDSGKGRNAHHLYVLRLRADRLKISRDRFLQQLSKERIGVSVHFKAVHLHPYYKRKYKLPQGSLPVAERASEEILSLPLYPKMTFEDARDVVKAVNKILHR